MERLQCHTQAMCRSKHFLIVRQSAHLVQRPLEKPRYIESDIDESKALFGIDSYPYIMKKRIDRNNS
jgi:hypothetical protein